MTSKLLLILLAIALFGTSCSKESLSGKIEVKGLVNPDEKSPLVSFVTTAPTTMNGWQDFELEYTVVDDPEDFSGISKTQLYYTPDYDTVGFSLVGDIPNGVNQKVQFCVPNLNHPKPAFKIIAFDNNNNNAEQTLGHELGQNFSINIETDPTVPTMSSSLGVLTKNNPTTMNISSCGYNSCSAGALHFNKNSNTTYLLVNTTGVQPSAGDAGWISCESVASSGMVQSLFGADGTYNYHLWSKSVELDFDGITSLEYISSTSSDVTITYDSTAPIDIPANLQFTNGFSFTGDNVAVTWNGFTDMNVVDHRIKTYKDSSCITGEAVHGTTSSGLAADSIIVDGLTEGQYWATVTAIDHVGLETTSACSTDSIIVDSTAPVDNGANLQFADTLDIDGDNLDISWTAFTDFTLANHRIRTYTNSTCTLGEVIHAYTGNASSADNASVDGLPTGDYWARVEAFDGFGTSTLSACSTDTIRVDKDSPIDNGANLQFADTHDIDGNNLSVSWTAFTDGNGIPNHKLYTYTNSACTLGETDHGGTGSGTNSDAAIIDGLADGQYWGIVESFDTIGNSTKSACSTDSIIVDATNPVDNTADIQFALVNTNLNNDVAISWTAFTDATLTNHRIHLYRDSATCVANETDFGLTGSTTNSNNTLIDGLADGVYKAKVTAIDFLGRSTQSACSTDTIIIDKTNPTDNTASLTFTNAYNNTGDNLAITWTAFSDSYLKEHKIITYTNSGCTLGAVDHGYNASTSNSDNTSVDGLTTGTYWATVTAIDEAGNTTTSSCSTDSIIIDTTKPTDNTANVQFTDAFDVDGDNLAITWTAFSDTNSIADHEILTYTDSGCTTGEIVHPKTASGTNSNSTTVDSLADDQYWAKVRAFDSAGNFETSACSSDSIIVDSQAPTDNTANIQFTLTHTNLNDNQAVTWTAFTDVTLANHQLYTYTDSLCSAGEVDHGLTGSSSASDSAVIDGLGEGQYWAKVKAIDQLSQSTTSACSTDSIIVDQTLPVDNGANLTFTNDYNNTGDNVAVTWTAFTDTYLDHHILLTYTDSGCTLGEVAHPSTGSATNSNNTVIDGLTDGVYYGKVKAVDAAGNERLSACSTDSITIDTIAPTDNTATLTFTNDYDNDRNDIAVTWSAFSDLNGIVDHRIITYTNSGCTVIDTTHALTSSGTNSDSVTVDVSSDGIKYAKVRAYDPAGNYTESACSTDSITVDSTAPVDAPANLQFTLSHYNSSDNVAVTWTAFTDLTLENHRLITYTDSNCTLGEDIHGLTGASTNSNNTIIDGLAEGQYWGKVVAIDHMGFETTSACSTDSIIIDLTNPTDNTATLTFTNDYSSTGDNVAVTWTAFSDTYLSDHRLYTYTDSGCSLGEIDHGLIGNATNSDSVEIDGLDDAGANKGVYYAIVEAIDLAGNKTKSACSSDYITVDETDPTDNTANLQFTNDYNNTGSNLAVTWTAFTDTAPGVIANHQIATYSNSACSTDETIHPLTGSSTNSDSTTVDGLVDGQYWAKVTSFDGAGNSVTSACSTDSIVVDTVAPDQSPLTVVGTVVTGQALGLYKLSACTDVDKVKITQGAGAPPLDGDSGWQNCDAVNYTITTTALNQGLNNLQFWIKDLAGNVQSTYLAHQTFYIPPTITVENGPTINTDVASMTINYCAESDISYVLFNETGTAPTVGDGAWQPCSKAIGALSSASLSPGDHTLKAFFKYSDDSISVVPMDVPVRYEPTIAWVETPSINRPHVSFTLGSCTGVSEILFNQGTQPAVGDVAWQPCSTANGGLTHTLTTTGSQSLNVWYKDLSSTVLSDYSQVTVNFQPPTASIFGGAAISTNSPKLSINDCTNISKVFVKLNDSTPTTPVAVDFTGSGQNCTTALNGIDVPVLPEEGVHTLDVWFYFSDAYILDPWYSRVSVTYTAVDTTAPPITGGQGAAVPLSMNLENGDASSPPILQAFSSRAEFTLNTCSPNPDVALTGTVTVSAASSSVTGSGTTFTTELSAGDFIDISGELLKIKSVDSNTALTLVLTHTAGATSVAATKKYPLDTITGMIITESSTAPSAADPDWLICSNATGALKSKSLEPDGVKNLYGWFKDAAGNLSVTSLSQQVEVQTSADTTPPPRPEVIVEGAPNLSTSPAELTITSCTDVDQVYLEPSVYPSAYVAPSAAASGWQNCSEAIGDIKYYLTLSGSYTLSVWFKDAAGNINPTPRDVSFIFDPSIGSFSTPLAYWTMDKVHKKTSQILDMKGDNHLYMWDKANLTEVTGRSNEAINFSGTNSYLFAVNDADLQPTISVTMSMWAYLTNSDVSTKALAGNIQAGVGGYGFKLNGGNLHFYASGQSTSVATSTYSTGWQHIVGTSDGRYINIYINGVLKNTFDMGAAANLTYGCSQVFAIGSDTDCSPNPTATNSFNERIDEVVIWGQYFTEEEVMSHFIDSFNDNKVGVTTTKPADIASATFYGEHLQNALLTVNDCGTNKFIYVNETTHPPTVDSDDWQLCTTVKGATIHKNLSQGPHELKIWGKDEYNNITNSYIKVDTTITGLEYQKPGLLYYSLDNNHLNLNTAYDIFSGHHATNVGASANQTGIQNEGFLFERANNDYLERKYSSNSQPTDKVTISVWANLTQGDNRAQVIAGNRMTNHGYSIEIDNTNSELRFFVESAAGTRFAGVSTASFTSGLHQIIGVYDGQVTKLYIDALEVASNDVGSVSPINYTCLSAFTIGAGTTCNSGPVASTNFDNIIDEVFVWNDALTQTVIDFFFNGQDTVPPLPSTITPKDNAYTVGIPIARFNVGSCSDIASVYIALDDTKPLANIDNWQSCATSGDTIKSPLLETGANTVKAWFKDAAGNVSDTSTDLVITYSHDFTIPNPNSYWTLDNVNIDGTKVFDVVSAKDGESDGTTSIVGKADEGLKFNGTSDFVEVPFDASFQPVNRVTLSAWFRTSSYDANDHIIVGNLNAGGYELALGNNTVEFRVQAIGSTQVASFSTGTLAVDTWHHVAGVWDDGTIRLFVNGSEEVNTVIAANANIEYTNSNSLNIGAAATTTTGQNGDFFSGDLDEIAFWNSALTGPVITEIFNRGTDEDKVFYDVTPPTIPVSLNIIYYNSLVSRANLTVTDCTGLDYIIVTNDEFPPDVNDEDWQLCNTLTGGLLSKELSSSENYGKFWTKDLFGNISKTFEYVPLVTNYDKPIARPVVHWTFDDSHYSSREALDRISQIKLKSDRIVNLQTAMPGNSCPTSDFYDGTAGAITPGGAGVLNEGLSFSDGKWLRSDHPLNSKTKPTSTISVATWVYLTGSASHTNEHIVSTEYNGKGWSLRLDAANQDDKGLRFTVHTTGGVLEPYLETKNYVTGWHLVMGVYDGQTASLYFDGIFVKSFSNASPEAIVYEPGVNTIVGAQASTTVTPTRWTIKSSTGGPLSCPVTNHANSYFEGNIDEVLVWDKGLTALEASSLYHNGADILYPTDTTAPALPSLTLENTRPDMFSDKAFFTLSTCSDISGVLVNEGTRPDKQDDRWEICRTRKGSFGIENLTDGGHTITSWYKDLAGNVTPLSADLVVNYNAVSVPYANASWPLDKAASVGNFARDVVELGVHDLIQTNIDTPAYPLATHQAGKVNEGLDLQGGGSYLSTPSTTLLSPVNFMTVGGWFYLTQSDTSSKVLIDHHEYTSDTNRGGYKIFLEGGQLKFKVELDIVKTVNLQYSTSSYTTGWHHVLGVWTGFEVKFYIDGTQVATTGTLAERDYMRYDDSTDFRIGAESDDLANPVNFFNAKVDEVALWGFDLSASQVTSAKTKGDTATHIADPLPTPSNVDNAYIYHYDNFGSRARMTMLNCTNTPWIYVTIQGGPAPSAVGEDWNECRTEKGAILSEKLPLTTTYVDVYSKNADGVVSLAAGTKEITPIEQDYDLVLPILYHSFNNDHVSGSSVLDFMSHVTSTSYGTPTLTSNLDGHEMILDGTDDYIDIPSTKNFDLRKVITIAIWADLTTGDSSNRRLVSRMSDVDDTAIILEDGFLKFKVNVTHGQSYLRTSDYTEAVFPTANIPTGKYFIIGEYDGTKVNLYLNSNLVDSADPGYNNFTATNVRSIAMDRVDGFRVSDSASSFWQGNIDEFMVFDQLLSDEEKNAHYRRYIDVMIPNDSTAPATVPAISVVSSTFGTNWPTDNANPKYTLDNCTDIDGVYITVDNATPPSSNSSAWQICSTGEGHFEGPTLGPGAHTVYFWFRDASGNVSPAQTIDVNYTIPPTYVPVAYWSMDDDTVVGKKIYEPVNQLHAEIYEADLVAGQVGTAAQFDGSRKYIEVEDNSIIKPVEQMSISFWANINADEDIRAYRTLLGNRGDSAEGFSFKWNCGESPCPASGLITDLEFFDFTLNLEGTDYLLTLPQAQIGSGWKHFVATFDGRYIKLYINAILRRELDVGVEKNIYYNPASKTSLIIGADASDVEKPSGSYFEGQIDEVTFWDKALHATHVTDLYNNYANNNAHIYDPALAVITPPNTRTQIHNSGEKSFGSRLRLTISDCSDMNMVLVNDSTIAPAANDENWQPCNTYAGGILSAPLSPGVVTPRVWARSFTGTVSASSGTANNATYNMPTYVSDIPRPFVHWSLDSAGTGYFSSPNIFDSLSWAHGKLDLITPPETTVTSGGESVIEEGFDFNGIDELISIHPTAATNPMYDLSISAWVELKKGETQHRHIVGNIQNNLTASGAGSGLRLLGGELQFYVTAWTGSARRTYTVGVDTNIFNTGLHHVTGVYNGRDLKLYLDGVFVKKYLIQFYNADRYWLYHDDYSHWTIGAETDAANAGASGTFFSGVVDDIRIWHTPLTEQQVFYAYEYGSDFLPTSTSDGIAPTDPGIFIANNQTTTSMPWMYFTMPTCTGANGVEINAIYINTDSDAAPSKDDVGWQYCSLDNAYLISKLIDRGSSNITVYFRDEEGDISGSTTFPVAYSPPELIHPNAYYSFNAVDRSSDSTFYDLAGGKTATMETRTFSPTKPGIFGDGYQVDAANWGADDTNQYPITKTSTFDYNINRNFTVAFWFNPAPVYSSQVTLLNTGKLAIERSSSDGIKVIAKHVGTVFSLERLVPSVWNHITVSRQDRNLKIYLNGKLDSSHLVSNLDLKNEASRLVFADSDGIYDELVTYESALTDEQVAYIYFKGEKQEYIDVMPDNVVQPKTPVNYWSFDDSAYSNPILSDIVGDIDLTRVSAVTTGAAGKVGEALSFTRKEDVIFPGGTPAEVENIVGSPEYLTAARDQLMSLPQQFTLSLWVKQPTSTGHEGDSTVVLDQWGIDKSDQLFRLLYTRGSTSPKYTFSMRFGNNDGTDVIDLETELTSFATTTDWVNLIIRRNYGEFTMYVNGRESGSANTNKVAAMSLTSGSEARLLFGESNLSGYEEISGYVTITSGTAVATGVGTQFTKEFFKHASGSVSIGSGTTLVTGLNTLFTTEFSVGDRIVIADEEHIVAAIATNTSLTLQSNHTSGATRERIRKYLSGTVDIASGTSTVTGTSTLFTTELLVGQRIRIGNEFFTVASIANDTSLNVTEVAIDNSSTANLSLVEGLTYKIASEDFVPRRIVDDSNLALSVSHMLGATGESIIYSSGLTNDEYRFNGSLDEIAFWDTAFSYAQVKSIYNKGQAGQAISVEPVLALDGNKTIISTPTTGLTLNSCNGYTHVWVGTTADADPLDGTAGWVACSTVAGAISSGALVSDSVNNIKIWFKTGSIVSTYTNQINITHVSGDTTPPLVPSITMESPAVTDLSFARFTIGNCSDIAGVYVGVTGPSPIATQSGWVNCTTINSAILSSVLNDGANSISIWFKDSSGNVTASSDFAITHNKPSIANPNMYLTFDDEQTETIFTRDISNGIIAQASNIADLTKGLTGQVDESIQFLLTSYYELLDNPINLTRDFTFASWIYLNISTSDSTLINRWDESQTDDQFSVRIDNTGRICLDLQTNSSAGTWNTASYKRVCSTGKITYNEWGHVGVTRSAGTIKFYYNNVLVGTEVVDSSNFMASSLPIRIANQERGGVSSSANGELDDMVLWDTVLTTTEFESVYAQGFKAKQFVDSIQPQHPAVAENLWNFDTASFATSTLSDVMGNNNLVDTFPLTAGAVSTGETGQIVDSIGFANGQIMEAASNTVNLGDQFTISTWVNLTDDSDDLGMIINKWNTADVDLQEFRLYTSAQTVVFDYHATTTSTDTFPMLGFDSITSIDKLSFGQWAHIAVTRKVDKLYMYINGNLQAIKEIGTDPMKNIGAVPLRFGGEDNTGSNFLTGKIDDTYISKSFSDERQIQYLYNLGASNSSAPSTVNPVISVAAASNTVSTTTAKLTISDCKGNAKVLIQDSGLAAPAAGALTLDCSSSVGAHVSSTLPATGNTVDVYLGDGSSTVIGPFQVIINYAP
ncbi:LamG-like jellyroll fold domain-containing protein [Halobacteriovorax sp. HLS]|uniref:LamG-like jellyroll fold domain-containing protein n=1 Tax=Halobacteriovorax sp. HLS TaxID=2234000 RepID=UPI000FDB9A4F|nr:LamG-like jellyroll fold domain-containing protein [Halobacteriovorax sp. HLS]